MITDDVIACWRTNYGLEDRTPAEAAAWWESKAGHAPSGAVAALGTCIDEIERLQRTLRDHLESESAETMRANKMRAERDNWFALCTEARASAAVAMEERDHMEKERDLWQAIAAAADADKRKAEEALAAARADIAAAQSDAERYRWLREHLPRGIINDCDVYNAASWDAAIDAALAEEKK